MDNYEELYESLKDKGYKSTHQRKIIFDALIEHKDQHLTIEELYGHIKTRHPKLGLTTVYRTIQMFCNMDIVEKVDIDGGVVRYELINDSDNHRHHHLICNSCNKIIEVKEDLMDSIEKIFEETYGFVVSNHQTKFFGLCENCRTSKSH